MDKKNYLSRGEQEIYHLIKHKSGGIISNNEIKSLFPRIRKIKINKICSSLLKKGYLYKLSKGLYLIQEDPGKPLIANQYKIALSLFNGYIGFSSALKIYGLLEYEPFTIYIATREKSREKSIGQYTFKAVSMGKRAVGETFYEGIYISTIEKTFFDCFYKPQYASYADLAKAIYLNKGCNWRILIGYFDSFASDSLCQRSGYIFDILKKETKLGIPDKFINYLKGRIKNKSRLVPKGKSKGIYYKEWKLMDNLGKDNILSWWKHG
ncbi:hypothetical protein J4443_04280 [Candidatus Woesearchaeota archaeon]|nr:hypothetical protein [Candidatus Woesearchaeota archaeon]